MLQKKLRSLESLWKFLADGLLDDSGAGESDQCFWLCQDNISQHGKACSHTTCRRVCKNRHIEMPCITMFSNGHTGFCHLHQGYQSLLHSGTAGTDIENHRKSLLCGTFKNPGDLFPNNLSHTGHHETAVTDTKRCRCPFYRTLTGNHSLVKSCLFTE